MMRTFFFILVIGFLANVLISAQVLYVLVNNGLGDNSDVSNQTIISNLIHNGHIGVFNLSGQHNLNTSTTMTTLEELPVKKDKQKITWLESNVDAIYDDDDKTIINIPGRPRSCSQCTCGLKFRYKIVNGYVSEKYEFPWLTLLLYQGNFLCGGSLINDLYVLSAAHCAFNLDATKFAVRFNEYDQFTTGETNSFEVTISSVLIHPQYNSQTLDFDYALLKLSTGLQLNALVPRPICLPIQGTTYDDQLAEVAGWGQQQDTGPAAGILLEAVLRIVPTATCNPQWGNTITPNMMCVTSKDKRNICFGDSGGPLMVVQNGRYRIAGVNSYIQKCVDATLPSVCSRVTAVLPWIKANTIDACYCADTV